MSNIPFNSPKAVCTASQIRSKLDQKLRIMLNEQRLIGPLDPYIIKAYEAGNFDEQTKDTLMEVSRYCDEVLLTSNYIDIPPFDTLLEWSKLIDTL